MATTLGSGSRWAEIDREMELLSHAYRRRVLRYLMEDAADAATLAELAAHVRRPDAAGDVNRTADDRVEVELYHLHLPKLDDAGLIDFDADTKTASVVDPADRVRELLDAASQGEPSP